MNVVRRFDPRPADFANERITRLKTPGVFSFSVFIYGCRGNEFRETSIFDKRFMPVILRRVTTFLCLEASNSGGLGGYPDIGRAQIFATADSFETPLIFRFLSHQAIRNNGTNDATKKTGPPFR